MSTPEQINDWIRQVDETISLWRMEYFPATAPQKFPVTAQTTSSGMVVICVEVDPRWVEPHCAQYLFKKFYRAPFHVRTSLRKIIIQPSISIDSPPPQVNETLRRRRQYQYHE